MSVISMPKELLEVLARDPAVMVAFKRMPASHKTEYINWVNDAKKSTTRYQRSEQIYQTLNDSVNSTPLSTGSLGESGKALVSKLELTPGMIGRAVDAPFNYAQLLVGDTTNITFLQQDRPDMDFVHVFCKNYQELHKSLSLYPQTLKPTAIIWISWPKQNSGLKTDLNKQIITDTAATIGWMASKICSIDQTWSALKLNRA